MDMVRIVTKPGRMPAYRAASGLAPTVRISKPSVLRDRSHHTTGTAAKAMKTPRWIWVPKIVGSSALPIGPVARTRSRAPRAAR